MLPKIAVEVVETISERYRWDEDTAVSMFMRSEVYGRLRKEDTGMWRLSTRCLADLFDDEYKEGIRQTEVV